MTALWAETALLPEGWAARVRLEIDAAGDLAGGRRRAPRGGRRAARRRRCCRACRTCTATPSSARWPGSPSASQPGEASFWTWREVMYRFLERIGPDGAAGDRRPALRRDAGGRLHRGRRVPLSAPPARRARLRRSGRAVLRDPAGAARRPASASPICRCSTSQAASAARRRSRASAASCTISRASRGWSSGCAARFAGDRRSAPRHRAAFAARRSPTALLRGDRDRSTDRPGRADPHPRRRAGARRSRDCLDWCGQRPVAHLLETAAGRPALVPDPRHPHGRRRDRGAGAERRGRGPVPDDRGQPRRRRCSTSRRISQPAGASASAPTATSRSARSRSCAGSSTVSAWSTLRRLVAASAAEPPLRRPALAGGAGRRRAGAGPQDRRARARLPRRPDPARCRPPAAWRPPRRRPARRPGLLRQRQPGARRHGRRPLAGQGRPPPRSRAHRHGLPPDHCRADLTGCLAEPSALRGSGGGLSR